jgi:hypothetical protein
MENQPANPETVPLIEGWMFGSLLYPHAMQQVADNPPANDE